MLPARSPALAAGRTGGGNRAAVVTGPRLERSAQVLGDVLSIAAASRGSVTDTVRAAAALDLAFAEARRLAGVFAPDDGASELAGLNRTAAERRVACSADLYAALEAAAALADETDGAYDPTGGPLLRAWDRRGGRRAPEASDLAAARLLVGRRMLLLDPATRTARFVRPGMEVALGAVARGVLLERVAGVLRERGIVRARLELGGDVFAYTTHDAWSAAIPGPADPGRAVMTLMVSNAAVATARSGREGTRARPRPAHGPAAAGRGLGHGGGALRPARPRARRGAPGDGPRRRRGVRARPSRHRRAVARAARRGRAGLGLEPRQGPARARRARRVDDQALTGGAARGAG